MEYIYDFLGVTQKILQSQKLVGGFNPFEEYWSKWESSPGRSKNKKFF